MNQQKLKLIRNLGLTSNTNASFIASGGEICFAAGAVVIFYSARRNRQTKFCLADGPVSAIALTNDKKYICVGVKREAGALAFFDVSTCTNMRTFDNAHPVGVGAISFSPLGDRLVSVGTSHSEQYIVTRWKHSSLPTQVFAMHKLILDYCPSRYLMHPLCVLERFDVSRGRKGV